MPSLKGRPGADGQVRNIFLSFPAYHRLITEISPSTNLTNVKEINSILIYDSDSNSVLSLAVRVSLNWCFLVVCTVSPQDTVAHTWEMNGLRS